MDRETYIKMRTEGSIEVMWEYYKEHFSKERHKNFLPFEQFVEFIQMYPVVQQAYIVSTEYYDTKFSVLKIPSRDKTLFI